MNWQTKLLLFFFQICISFPTSTEKLHYSSTFSNGGFNTGELQCFVNVQIKTMTKTSKWSSSAKAAMKLDPLSVATPTIFSKRRFQFKEFQ